MKILNCYVTRGFLLAFFMAMGILSFAMLGGSLLKVLDLVSQGIPLMTFLEFMLYNMPRILTFTIPWAAMVAVMLVFGRMSADSEITAMRACGVSILQTVSPILIFAIMLTGICLYLHVELGPPLLGKSREMLSTAAIKQPLAIFEPGKPIYYSNTIIYIDDKINKDELKGVQIYTLADHKTADQDITAESGKLKVDPEREVLIVTLYDCLISDKRNSPLAIKNITPDNKKNKDITAGSVNRFYAQELQFEFNYGEQANANSLIKRPKYLTLYDLMARIRLTKQMKRDTTFLEVELNKRIAFALSPIAFLLLGLPLAIRTSRRETSVGMFLSVILAGLFFLLVIFCESLQDFPYLYPQYLLWLPNILFQVVGAIMIYRISQR